ncbi:MAG: hypothetical protein K2U26_05840 [Cyclobacteriaceae bacterium]|nr:hypothetical protein [Cyclobacteriaceae bacterium]
MNLDNLKPAWQQFRLVNSMQSLDKHDILSIIERAEEMSLSKINQYLINFILFTVLTICCQGG